MQPVNKNIDSWLEDIRRGIVRLPRFQRREAWSYKHVENFLDALIIRNGPIGVLLTLEVDPNRQPFFTRSLEGTENNGELCRTHLLDGQQRLTAIWKALNDLYDDRIYLVKFENRGNEYCAVSIESVTKNKQWAKSPESLFDCGYLPVNLLYPKDGLIRIEEWIRDVGKRVSMGNFRSMIIQLWHQVSSKSFPCLSLPQATSAEDAIDIFINTNTSFVKLTPYNIAVAQFEAATQESLQVLVDKIGQDVSGIVDLEGEDNLGDLVLKVACLFQGKMPTYGNYRNLDMQLLMDQHDKILSGIKWATEIVNKQKIWKERQLPTSVPLRVLPALHQFLPQHGDDRAKADRLVIQYLWRSFFTNRYDRQANSRLKKDYDALRRSLENKKYSCSAEIFSEPLPKKEDLLSEGWPRSRGIRKRAIIAICNKQGARDVASNVELNSVNNRHYHHIFPRGLFKRLNIKNCDPELALNCMLIDEPSNLDWSARWPGDYILERIENSGLSGKDAKQELRSRLESHLLPSDIIVNATEDKKKLAANIYKNFLNKRANLVVDRMKELCK